MGRRAAPLFLNPCFLLQEIRQVYVHTHLSRFQVADALQPLPFEDGEFDFVHARLMSPFIPIKAWPQVVREMARVLKHGGIIEVVDGEQAPQSPSSSFKQVFQFPQALLEQRGLHVGMGDSLMGYFQQAGIQRIQQRKFPLGRGRNTSETARQQRLLAADLLAAMANFKPLAVQHYGISEGEFDRLCQQAKEEVPRLGIYWPVVFCLGTKL